MTAYEYADLAASNYAISFTILSFLIALASAYFGEADGISEVNTALVLPLPGRVNATVCR